LISRFDKPEKLDNTFIFPYSADEDIKQKQIWENLQKGLLLEDKGVLIPWLTPFNQVDRFKEKRRDSGDRTEWYLGKHRILDGFEGEIEVMMWMYLPWTNPLTEVKGDLGYDHEGMNNFCSLKRHLVTRLGEPDETDVKAWGDLDLGTIEWRNDKVKISLVGIEHFNARYSFHIGLIQDRNKEYFDKKIAEIKSRGLSIEELAK
jgi:hypothetical protein